MPKEKFEPRRRLGRPPKRSLHPNAGRELLSIILFLVAVVGLLAIINLAGPLGISLNSALSALFGLNKIFVPAILIFLALKLWLPERMASGALTNFGAILFLLSLGGLLNLIKFKTAQAMLFLDNIATAGGYLGLIFSYPAVTWLGFWAGLAVLIALLLISMVIVFNVSFHELAVRLAHARHFQFPWPFGHRQQLPPQTSFEEKSFAQNTFNSRPIQENLLSSEAKMAAVPARGGSASGKKYPPISIPTSILDHKQGKPSAGDIGGRMAIIQKTLENFDIPVEMGEVSVGPTVAQFSLKPADGIKLAKITGLSNDLALALAAHPIRIEAPIPGKSLVGIEVPNHTIAIVGLRDILESKEFKNRRSNLTVCLGKDVAGIPWVADLAKMPHLLVAGATGSGKTVCLNTIILSLLFQNSPDQLKLMLIDPKRVELPVYNGLPHLLTPAITEVPKIINALKWTIGEMERRFETLSKSGKRDISSYNETVADKMPYIVIIIDELADLMVAASHEVEASIIRLAQMARAVGIHLVVATQRPSVDVITGLIKANITSRVAFSVASSMDSRTILDTPGAEKLVGRGDMLFVNAELSRPKRIQCCYVSDTDIRKVVDHIKTQLDEPVVYMEGITEKQGGSNSNFGGIDDDVDDELYQEAKEAVVRAGKASASYLQRKLKIGYARSARLLDILEERGIIGPGDGAKPRDILVTSLDGIPVPNHNNNEDELL